MKEKTKKQLAYFFLASILAVLCIVKQPVLARGSAGISSAPFTQVESDLSIHNQLNQIQQLQALGQYRKVCQALLQTLERSDLDCQSLISDEMSEQVTKIFPLFPTTSLRATALRNLGDMLRMMGALNTSEALLKQSLKIAQEKVLVVPDLISTTYLSLGNTQRAKGKRDQDLGLNPSQNNYQYEAALESYEKSILYSNSNTLQLRAKLNKLSLVIENRLDIHIGNLWQEIQLAVENLPASAEAAYIRTDLAQSLACLKLQEVTPAELQQMPLPLPPLVRLCASPEDAETDKNLLLEIAQPQWEYVALLLAKAEQQADQLQDHRLQSYVLGNLGELYEITQQWFHAKTLTETALNFAQSIQAWDIAYRWQWQLGRLEAKEKGYTPKAISFYEGAVANLQSLRGDLIGLNAEVQFSFRDNVEPIYRELIAAILPPEENNPTQTNLQKAIYFTDSLQLAELENFLQCNLQTIRTVVNTPKKEIELFKLLFNRIEKVINDDSKTALIYPIILPEHLAVLVKVSGQDKLLYHPIKIKEDQVRNKLEEISNILQSSTFSEFEDKDSLQEIYSWLINPFKDILSLEKIKNLVFVLDGSFRKIPMATLHDSQNFLIKNYTVSLVPSIQLLQPQGAKPIRLKALVAGLSGKREDLSFNNTIPNAVQEVELLSKILTNPDPTILREREFTKEAFQNKIQSSSYDLIHLATHGRFSSDLYNTIILTASQDPLRLNELEGFLRNRTQNISDDLWLLVLSACDTAAGDNRAVLGIAGVAVKSGALSTLATLWLADELSTKVFMEKFYIGLLKDKLNKAEAMRQAQLDLLENRGYDSPYQWAPFVLVGNWM